MTEQMKSSLKTSEPKILRKIYGPTEDQNGWRIRTSDELQAVYKKPNIVTTIKVRRLEWAGHVVRMSDDRTVKKVLGKTDGRRIAGRPKVRWFNCIEYDLKMEMEEESRRHICTDHHSEGSSLLIKL